jgi:DNA repair protein RecN (Recombination protein N)
MLVDALALLLGERASGDLVRPGADRAVVEAAFEVRGDLRVAALADELGLDLEDGRLVVRREIQIQGRNRAWANGSPTTVAVLAQVGRLLVDLHGQHEAQSLLTPTAQRDILDAFGDCGADRERVATAHAAATALREEEAQLVARRDDVRRRADYLRHVVREIEAAAPRPGEDEALDLEARRLANVEELSRLTQQIGELVEGGDAAGALSCLSATRRALGQLERIDDSVGRWRELLEAAHANLEELALAVREYAVDIERDPGRLEEVERRRDVLYRLRQKYGATIADVLRTAEEARRELDLLDTADLDLSRLGERRAAAEAELEAAAADLRARRTRAAGRLARAVEALLPGLGMPHGRFRVDLQAAQRVTAAGADAVSYLVQLNPGLDARPLAQVASGGELSRLMLALKVVLARHDAVPTLVFDEVDQGIGAEVGLRVAEALAEVARARQVLVITHLAQIAAAAAHHLAVAKRARGGVATADVRVLSGEERAQELARMLGDARDPVVRRHAEELLRKHGAPTAA